MCISNGNLSSVCNMLKLLQFPGTACRSQSTQILHPVPSISILYSLIHTVQYVRHQRWFSLSANKKKISKASRPTRLSAALAFSSNISCARIKNAKLKQFTAKSFICHFNCRLESCSHTGEYQHTHEQTHRYLDIVFLCMFFRPSFIYVPI